MWFTYVLHILLSRKSAWNLTFVTVLALSDLKGRMGGPYTVRLKSRHA